MSAVLDQNNPSEYLNDPLLARARELAASGNESIWPVRGRVAYVVSHGITYASNGYAIRTHAVARALRARGLEILCLVRPGRPWELLDNPRPLAPETLVDGVRYVQAPWPAGTKPGDQQAQLEHRFEQLLAWFRLYRPAAVVAASNWIVGLPAWAAARRLDLPFLNEVRGFWELSRDVREPGYAASEAGRREAGRDAFVAREASTVFTLNWVMKSELVQRGVARSSIQLVPNGMSELPSIQPPDPALRRRLGIDPEDKVVGYVGSFSAYEGLDGLIEACERLYREDKRLRLLMVGDDQPVTVRSGNADNARSGPQPWLVQVGRVPHAEVADFYALMDVVVVPRADHPVCRIVSPMKVVEAMAHEKPLIVSDLPALRASCCDGTHFVPPGNPVNELQNVIRKALAAPPAPVDMELRMDRLIEPMLARLSKLTGAAEPKARARPAKAKAIPPPIAAAEALLQSARKARSSGEFTDEWQLMCRAAEQDASTRMRKAAFWAAIRAHEFSSAQSFLQGLRSDLRDMAADRAWLEKAERAVINRPIDPAELQRAVSECEPRRLDTVPGRLAYLLHNALPYSSGGYATRAHGMACGLRQVGMEPICITRPGFPVDTTDLAAADIADGHDIDGVSYRHMPEPSRRQYRGQGYIEMAARAVRDMLCELRPEAVMAASNHLTAFPALLAARQLGLPFIYEVRGFWEVTRASREPEFAQTQAYADLAALEALAANMADHVFTLTTPMKEELVARGVPAEKITLAPNSVDPGQFEPRPRDQALAAQLGIPDQTPVIGYIGSFVQYEGLEHLAQACARLAQRGLDFRLLLVGNENVSGSDRGPITAEIERVAREEGLADRLIMPGRIPHEQVAAHYSLIDIAPFPRKPQPVTEMVSPMKPLEAFAMEKAVVVSSVRALGEMVRDGETGLVFAKGDVAALAEVLEKLLTQDGLRQDLSRAGRAWVESHRTWRRLAADVKEMISGYCGPTDQ